MSTVYIVGAGPGDPELLTLKALKAIEKADVVLYDRLVSDGVLALVPSHAEKIYVGKDHGDQEKRHQEISDHFIRYTSEGKTVVRLKGEGDPLVFGRGIEEWLFVKELGHEVIFIPGITSAIAVPGLAGIPLTARNVSSEFAVIAGHCCDGKEIDWGKFAQIDTLVILMGVTNRDAIAKLLINAGRPSNEPVAFIENGTCPQERIIRTTLNEVATGNIEVISPAVFIVGAVSTFHDRLG